MSIHYEDEGIGSYEYWGFRGCDVRWVLVDDADVGYDGQSYYISVLEPRRRNGVLKDVVCEYFIDGDVFEYLCENYPDRVTKTEDGEELFDGCTYAEVSKDPTIIDGVYPLDPDDYPKR